ncbi:AraC family transcriptional regulator [Pseudanabaena sp. FACHB-2040]|uniref:helix-turn-helix domain-containing protein n=1 Tax=Pseudanabaena sp. FACHB-2040 TaxID=2692859 RepID=UPI00168963DE|nr:AraC family transcriptional regulator [Pseudanabaena sp. FACHB-2040]MBD2258208.1 helix-turn-helix transcriptional regulator [Pseudanabaena sp. FACHB-2040]
MSSVVVDFAKEKEEGYKRIFARPPLLSSVATQWDGILTAYDYMPPGETPEISVKQHGIGIFVDLPQPVLAERFIDGQFRREYVSPGDMVVVPADTWHRTRWTLAGGVIVIGLEPKTFTQTVDETVGCDRIELIPHFATADPLVQQIGLALKRALENAGSGSRLYAETMTTALMVHLLQYYSAQQLTLPIYSGGLPYPQLRRIVDYIQAHLDQDLSLRDLAAVVQLSPHYFSQLFKQSTGVTPHQYVIQRRVERAKELLKQTQLTLADVARVVGFVDQSHFHRHFKRLVGITPRAFLKQVRSY